MPLIHGKSEKAFKKNVETEMKANPGNRVQNLAIAYSIKKKAQGKKMAMGGFAGEEKASGYMDHEGDVKRPNGMAMGEDDKDLNQHKVMVQDSMKDSEVDHEMEMDSMDYSGLDRLAEGDVVGRVMKKYSEGGKIANGGDDDLGEMADSSPNEFDDLALRDDLESSSDGANNGDFLGNTRTEDDNEDIVARIMRKMAKPHNPRPA